MVNTKKQEEEKALPNFLGIGVARSGTTWLYELLSSHPDIYMNPYRKELHFFDNNYEKGIDWYKQFFPNQNKANSYKSIGEVTPQYIYLEKVPELVKKDLGEEIKFIVILRNPVDRLISHFKKAYKDGQINNINIEKNEFLELSKNPIERGFYAEQLKNWFKHFNRENFLILIFEDLISKPDEEIKKIANFLNVDEDKFKIPGKKNESYIPRFHFLFKLGIRINNFFVNRDMNRISNFIQNTGKLLKPANKIESNLKTPESTKKGLYEIYEEDIEELEELINKDLSHWKRFKNE